MYNVLMHCDFCQQFECEECITYRVEMHKFLYSEGRNTTYLPHCVQLLRCKRCKRMHAIINSICLFPLWLLIIAEISLLFIYLFPGLEEIRSNIQGPDAMIHVMLMYALIFGVAMLVIGVPLSFLLHYIFRNGKMRTFRRSNAIKCLKGEGYEHGKNPGWEIVWFLF